MYDDEAPADPLVAGVARKGQLPIALGERRAAADQRDTDDGEDDREMNDLRMNRSETRHYGVLDSAFTVAAATTTEEPAAVPL